MDTNTRPLVASLTRLVNDPAKHDCLAIVKGFRNGAVYGAKIRFPHALVMTFLFRTGSFADKMKFVLKATKAHSRNLAYFVATYKTLMFLQRRYLSHDGSEKNHHPFLAGLIGGYLIFGENNNINQQIVLYLFSRIVMSMVKVPVHHKVFDEPKHTFPVFAAVVWGIVMWLFRHERETLQPSLQASMQYLYLDSNHWNTLRNFIWHNK